MTTLNATPFTAARATVAVAAVNFGVAFAVVNTAAGAAGIIAA